MWQPDASTAEQQATSDYGSAVASTEPKLTTIKATPSNLNVTPTHHEPESFTFPILPLIAQSSSRPPTRHLKHSFLGDCLIPNTSQHGELASSVLTSQLSVLTRQQPSATGSSWEKYQKNYADDEVEEKKITPLSDESVLGPTDMEMQLC